MSKTLFTGISVEKVVEKTGLLGRKIHTDELLRMELPGGSITLRRSAVIAAGDNYFRLKSQLAEAAEKRGIPWNEPE